MHGILLLHNSLFIMGLVIEFPLDAHYAHEKRPENIKDLASGYCSVARVPPDLLLSSPLPFTHLLSRVLHDKHRSSRNKRSSLATGKTRTEVWPIAHGGEVTSNTRLSLYAGTTQSRHRPTAARADASPGLSLQSFERYFG